MRLLALGMTAALLAGCGTDEAGEAASLCSKEVMSRLSDQMAQLDEKDMQTKATTAADGTITINAQIVFRAGTSEEATQPFTCTVETRNEKGEYQPRVIQVHIDPLGYKKTG